jgi:hypothetical protein
VGPLVTSLVSTVFGFSFVSTKSVIPREVVNATQVFAGALTDDRMSIVVAVLVVRAPWNESEPR